MRKISKNKPQILRVQIDSIHPDPANVRRHPEKNIQIIKASLQRFGQQKPIVVDKNSVIRAGNGTYTAAKALGWTHIDIIRTQLTGPDAAAYAIADNRSAELAEWDVSALMQQCETLEPALQQAAGFTPDEIKKLAAQIQEPPTALDQEGLKNLEHLFEIVVRCRDEEDQRGLFERLTGEGRKCRVLTI